MSWFIVGCTVESFILFIQAIASKAPEAPNECPIMDFVELIGILYERSLKTFFKARVSN